MASEGAREAFVPDRLRPGHAAEGPWATAAGRDAPDAAKVPRLSHQSGFARMVAACGQSSATGGRLGQALDRIAAVGEATRDRCASPRPRPPAVTPGHHDEPMRIWHAFAADLGRAWASCRSPPSETGSAARAASGAMLDDLMANAALDVAWRRMAIGKGRERR